MEIFKDALDKIAKGLGDASKLDIITFQGSVAIKANVDGFREFDSILKEAHSAGDLKLLASTQYMMDGDVTVFLDKEITKEQVEQHLQLVKLGQESRMATVNFLIGLFKPS